MDYTLINTNLIRHLPFFGCLWVWLQYPSCLSLFLHKDRIILWLLRC